MLHHSPATSLPHIVVSEAEEHRLTVLATAKLSGRQETFALALLAELERADVVPEGEMPSDAVRMDSWVEFEIDGRDRRRVQIVYPGDANIDADKISILTPIGTALIGLSPGQSMALEGHDGRPHALTVLSVAQPASSA